VYQDVTWATTSQMRPTPSPMPFKAHQCRRHLKPHRESGSWLERPPEGPQQSGRPELVGARVSGAGSRRATWSTVSPRRYTRATAHHGARPLTAAVTGCDPPSSPGGDTMLRRLDAVDERRLSPERVRQLLPVLTSHRPLCRRIQHEGFAAVLPVSWAVSSFMVGRLANSSSIRAMVRRVSGYRPGDDRSALQARCHCRAVCS
jgi:hypothetical protein